jgi:bile acid:Na+ symporter, BASS family
LQRSTIIRRCAERVPDALPVLALAAAGLARLVPSHAIADHVDLLLAALVLLTALDIDPRQLTELAGHVRTIVLLVVVPAFALAALGWLISRFVAGDLRDGVLALGFAPAEVASVGLIGLIGGMAEAAIAVVGLSLVVSAVAGPPLLAAIAGGAQAARPLALLGHFALIVLLPLLAGLVIRGLTPALARRDAEISLGSTLILLLLIFGSLTGTGAATLGSALLVSVAFLSCSSLVAWVTQRTLSHRLDPPLALTIGMRDFAVAAALAAAAFGPRAAQVAGVYGTVMLIAAAIVSALLARATPRTRR